MRKPISVSTTDDGFTIVVCDDGAVYHYHYGDDGAQWKEENPVPGTERAHALKYEGEPRDANS